MKKIRIIIFSIILLMVFSVNIFADETTTQTNNGGSSNSLSCRGIEESAEAFKSTGEDALAQSQTSTGCGRSQGTDRTVVQAITENIGPLYRMLTTTGILIIGICMVILGIQWVGAKASPDAQAKLKHKLVALVIAAGVMFGSYTIWSIIVKVLDTIDG